MQDLIILFNNLKNTKNLAKKDRLLYDFWESVPEHLKAEYHLFFADKKKGFRIKKDQAIHWAKEHWAIPTWLFEECLQETKDWRLVFSSLLPHPKVPWEETLSSEQWLHFLRQVSSEKNPDFTLERFPKLSQMARIFLLELGKRPWAIQEENESLFVPEVASNSDLDPKQSLARLEESEALFELLYYQQNAMTEIFTFGVAEGFPVLVLEKEIPKDIRKQLKGYCQSHLVQKFGPTRLVQKGLIARISFTLMKENLRKKSGLEIADPKIIELIQGPNESAKAITLDDLRKKGKWT